MENSFIQWNCRGFRNKLEEIQLFIKNHNPIAICLQETLLKDNESLSIKNYTTYNYTQSPTTRPHLTTSVRPRRQRAAMCKICTSLKQPYTWEIYSVIISMCIGCTLEIYIWLSNKVFCNIHIGDTLNYLNSRCNTAKLLWVVIYVVCYGCFSPDLVVMNICRQRLIKVEHLLRQRSLANENAVVCRQG